MNIYEFRKALSSEATKQSISMETELKKLRKKTTEQTLKIRELGELIRKNHEDINALQNRCAAFTRFCICDICEMKLHCQALTIARTRAGQGGVLQ